VKTGAVQRLEIRVKYFNSQPHKPKITNQAMIKPYQKDKALLTDIESFTSNEGFKIWWLGQSGFLVKWQNRTVLFDPYLSDSLSIKYENTDKPHVRMSELVIDPNFLTKIDIVTSSHNHTDHLDAETLIPILKNNPECKFIIPEANQSFVTERVKCEINFPIGLNDGVIFEHLGFKITGLPAAHNTIERNEKGECKFMGFILQFDKYTIYHSGDTLLYDGLVEILKPYQLDIALLPINGNKPERKVAGNLNPAEATQLAKTIDAKLTIPHHYHLFEFNTENPELFENECLKKEINYKILHIGEGILFT
jgi:L-ascorbate metabolism protein UlaG (beta-lactamase superfamily)